MKRRLVVSAAATWLAVLLMVPAAGAYPISPVPLFDLVNSSELVVMAEVVEIREEERLTEPTPEYSNALLAHLDQDAVARLRVVETWKGEPMAAVDVLFPRSLICPAPPRYVEGKVVIAFLTFLRRARGAGRRLGSPTELSIHGRRTSMTSARWSRRQSYCSACPQYPWPT